MKKIRTAYGLPLRKIFALAGVMFLFGFSLLFYWAFLAAFIKGGKTTVLINEYGEALPEFFMIPVCLCFGLYSIWYLYKDLKPVKEVQKCD